MLNKLGRENNQRIVEKNFVDRDFDLKTRFLFVRDDLINLCDVFLQGIEIGERQIPALIVAMCGVGDLIGLDLDKGLKDYLDFENNERDDSKIPRIVFDRTQDNQEVDL